MTETTNPRAELRPHLGKALDLLEWTQRRRPWLIPDRRFDLERHPYLREIYETRARQVVIQKAAQMGASEWLISYAFHACDERKATALYVFPTDKNITAFSAARIGPAIEASPYLKEIVITGDNATGQKGADRVTLKRIRNRFLYLRGGKVDKEGMADQLKSIDADVLILDERDEMDPAAPAIAEKRLGHSVLQEIRQVSTPTYPGRGINAEYLKSDQRVWQVKCPSCGDWQAMSLDQVVQERDDLGRPTSWWGKEEGRAFVACRRCSKELDRLAVGRWEALNPQSDVAGYHMTGLFNSYLSVLQIIQGLQKLDEKSRQETVNQGLGLPYSPRGGGLTVEILDACRREYVHKVVKDEPTFMGVDVGGLLHVVIRGLTDKETGERQQRFAGEVGWDALPDLMKRYNVQVCVIDALPETKSSRDFQAAFHPGRVWLAYYPNQSQGNKSAEAFDFDLQDGVVNIDRTRALDELMADFLAGVASLPIDAADLPDYYDQMRAPIRRVSAGANGVDVARYIEQGPDHFAHAENYCRIAQRLPRDTAPRLEWLR